VNPAEPSITQESTTSAFARSEITDQIRFMWRP
jgi:hypothetical protein